MSAAARRPRGRPRDRDADAAILRAALEMFLERGVDGTSIEQVARRAGVGKVTVYRRWDTKEDMIAQAIESARGEIPDVPVDGQSDLPLADQVAHAIPSIAETAATPGFRALVSRVFGAATSHPALVATYWDHYVEPRRAATRRLLQRAIAQGAIAHDADLDVLIDMMVGAVMYRVIQPDVPDAAQMRRYLESVYRQAGLLPPA
jgi:AcrR family transcriptional regulator